MKRVFLLLPLVLLAGCTAGTTPGVTASPQVSLPPENPAPGDHETAFLDTTGEVRRYIVHAPPNYAPGGSRPLVLVFHGSPGEAERVAQRSKMNEVADANDFLVVYPRYLSNPEAVGDLIDHMIAKWGVDPRRVHAAGFSRGASFTYRLARELPDRFGSLAPVSGNGASDKPLARPISLITFQGNRDTLDVTFPQNNNKWAKAANCTEETLTTITMAGAPAYVRTAACAGGAEHVVYSLTETGHEWPAGASELIWQFFAKHPLP